MLRANVGLSRKVSKDFCSTGYSINIDGEVTATVSDPEAVMEQVKQLFDLAEEALALQIERAHSEAALASHDEVHHPLQRHDELPAKNGSGGKQQALPENGHRASSQQHDEPATNKQINYLLNIGKRLKLSTAQLESKAATILGRQVGLYDMTKQAAAIVIDQLTNGAKNGRSTSRY